MTLGRTIRWLTGILNRNGSCGHFDRNGFYWVNPGQISQSSNLERFIENSSIFIEIIEKASPWVEILLNGFFLQSMEIPRKPSQSKTRRQRSKHEKISTCFDKTYQCNDVIRQTWEQPKSTQAGLKSAKETYFSRLKFFWKNSPWLDFYSKRVFSSFFESESAHKMSSLWHS